jgi:hypothetical protein
MYLTYWEVTCQTDGDYVGTVKASQTSRKVHLRRYTVACMRIVMCPKHACPMRRGVGLKLVDHRQAIFGRSSHFDESRRNVM